MRIAKHQRKVSDLPRTATVRAKSSVDVISVARPTFKTLIARFPGVQANINEALIRHGVDPASSFANQQHNECEDNRTDK